MTSESFSQAYLNLYLKEKMISISWIGGAGAVGRTDWSPLKGREVIIWPDNDKAGFEASDTLCRNLQQTGLKSLSEVNREHLTIDLPPKWDLADTLPEDKDPYFINRTLLRASERKVEISYKDLSNQSHPDKNLEINQKQASKELDR